jgi:hypothetical protein
VYHAVNINNFLVPWVQTSDAERIGVDQVAKILPSGKASGPEQRECAWQGRGTI